MCQTTGASAAQRHGPSPSIGVRTSSHFTYGLRASRFSTLSRCSAALTGWSGSTSRARLAARRPSSMLRKGTRELASARAGFEKIGFDVVVHARKVLLGQLCPVEHEVPQPGLLVVRLVLRATRPVQLSTVTRRPPPSPSQCMLVHTTQDPDFPRLRRSAAKPIPTTQGDSTLRPGSPFGRRDASHSPRASDFPDSVTPPLRHATRPARAIHLTLRWELDLDARTPSSWVPFPAMLLSRLLASPDSMPTYGKATVASFPSWTPAAGSHTSGHHPLNPNMPTSETDNNATLRHGPGRRSTYNVTMSEARLRYTRGSADCSVRTCGRSEPRGATRVRPMAATATALLPATAL
ncbi:hypothetical protein VTO73DRAFT_244 [Trametes versicolor]